MKSFHSGAVALIGASVLALGGCAADPQQEKTAEARDSCMGVAPPTGSLVRRKEDCGALRQGGGISEDVRDEIRRSTGGMTPGRPAGLGGGG